MSSTTLDLVPQNFPPGTKVAVRERSAFSLTPDAFDGPPPEGKPLSTVAVGNDGGLEVSGLTPGVEYVGHAEVDEVHRYVHFFGKPEGAE